MDTRTASTDDDASSVSSVRLHKAETDELFTQWQYPKKQCHVKSVCSGYCVIIVGCVTIFLLALYTSLALLSSNPPKFSVMHTEQRRIFAGFSLQTDSVGTYIQCPEASSDARKAGCYFDVLLYGWLPEFCFDQVMYDDITKGKDFGFYEDREGLFRIPQAELMQGMSEKYPEAYVSTEEHWQHCIYMLNTSIAFRQKEPPTYLNLHLDQGHIGHCLHFLTDPETNRSLEVTMTKAKFIARRKCYLQQSAQFR